MLQQFPSIAFSPWIPLNKGSSLWSVKFKSFQFPMPVSCFHELKDLHTDGKNTEKLTVRGFKWRLVIAYDGTRFSGWQYQQSTPTVQCIVEEALTQITKLGREELQLVGAGRTDAGVHAWGQVAHFITPFNHDNLESIHRALNGLLPSDIRIREISSAVHDFHARFSVKSKIYNYKIYNDTIMDPFLRHYAYRSVYKLSTAAMRDAAKHFLGIHNFSAFANASRNDRTPNPVKNIFHCDVTEMVALLLQVGREAASPDIVPKILASCDRKELAKHTYLPVPPHGLCLMDIKYNEEHLHLPPDGPPTSFGRHNSIKRCKRVSCY